MILIWQFPCISNVENVHGMFKDEFAVLNIYRKIQYRFGLHIQVTDI